MGPSQGPQGPEAHEDSAERGQEGEQKTGTDQELDYQVEGPAQRTCRHKKQGF